MFCCFDDLQDVIVDYAEREVTKHRHLSENALVCRMYVSRYRHGDIVQYIFIKLIVRLQEEKIFPSFFIFLNISC